MNLKARERVAEIIWSFFDHYRFYYYLLTSMARVEDSKWCPSMGVGFIHGTIPALFYNPEWVNERSDAELLITLNHECQHIALKHLLRGRSSDRMIANLAMDVVVNSNIPQLDQVPEFRKQIITADKFEELKGRHVRDMTWEEIYDLIKPKIDQKRKEWQELLEQIAKTHEGWSGDDGSGMPQELTPDQQAALKGLMKEAVKQLGDHQPGNVPGSIRRVIEEMRKIRTNWKSHLNLFAQSVAREEVDHTWKKMHRRFGVTSPGHKKDYRPRLLGVIDNSGSISPKVYNDFVAHICKIAEACETIDGIGVDTQVNFEFEFKGGKTPKHEDTHSGGGTMFQPAFDYAKGRKYDGIIYFTDGYCFDSDKLETYHIPTIFAICPGGKPLEGHRNIILEDCDESW